MKKDKLNLDSFDKYKGLMYFKGGHGTREKPGYDCWTLTREFYKNELGISLPDFSNQGKEANSLEFIESVTKESWEEVQEPKFGDVVCFWIMGRQYHFGVYLGKNLFLHIREGSDSVVESVKSPRWKKRVLGFFRYKEDSLNKDQEPFSEALTASTSLSKELSIPKPRIPSTTALNPFKMAPVLSYCEVGDSIRESINKLLDSHGISSEIRKHTRIVAIHNTRVLEREDWDKIILKEGDNLVLRALPGDDSKQLLAAVLMVAVAIYAPYAAKSIVGASSGIAFTAVNTAIMMAGTYAVQALTAPSMPDAPQDPGQAEQELMAQGGTNQDRRYEAIPLVLGRVRMTPPIAAQNYFTHDSEGKSTVNQIFLWGYGPLHIEEDTILLGEIPLENIIDTDNTPLYKQAHLTRKSGEDTQTNIDAFNSIYGSDLNQKQVNLELVNDVDPAYWDFTYYQENSSMTVYVSGSGDSTVNRVASYIYLELHNPPIDRLVVTFDRDHLSNVLRSSGVTNISFPDARKVEFDCTAYKLGDDWPFIGIEMPDNSGSIISIVPKTMPSEGNWVEVATTENSPVSIKANVHFPSGLRWISTGKNKPGQSYKTFVDLGIAYSHDGITWEDYEQLRVEALKKDAFTYTFTKDVASTGYQYFRIRRENGSRVEDNPDRRYAFEAHLMDVSFITNNRPTVDPVGCKLAKTAFRVQATDQLGQNAGGYNAIVQSVVRKHWNGSSWINQEVISNNPAELIIHLLQHESSPRPQKDSQIDWDSFGEMADFCNSKGYAYNSIIASPKSILSLINEVASAARCIIIKPDGKFKAVVDGEKPVIQHFSGYNSSGFSFTRRVPMLPDGIRVKYNDEDQGFQESEIIIYEEGKNAGNSTIFESMRFPGVTNKDHILDLMRWHYAQAKLRPEIYSFSADWENLVCTRGDRIKVASDVVMWGYGGGRIKEILSNTKVVISDPVYLSEDGQYSARIRCEDNSSLNLFIIPPSYSGYYSEISFFETLPDVAKVEGNLILIGELENESQDLLITDIQMGEDHSATIQCVDYGVTSEYNLFDDYPTLSSDVVFEAQISHRAKKELHSFADKYPLITKIRSDEEFMEIVSPGEFSYSMAVSFYVDQVKGSISNAASHVQFQYQKVDSTGTDIRYGITPIASESIILESVDEGDVYQVRARYLNESGQASIWSPWVQHTIQGGSFPPSQPTGLTVQEVYLTGKLRISWNKNPEVDIQAYELRTDASFGSIVGQVFFGDNLWTEIPYDGAKTYYLSAYDFHGNYSTGSFSSLVYTPSSVLEPINPSHEFSSNRLTVSSLTLNWERPVSQEGFEIKKFLVEYNGKVVETSVPNLDVPIDWTGSKTFTIKSVDINQRESTGINYVVQKEKPNQVTNFRAQVIDNNVMLYWSLPNRTSLPIDHTILVRGDSFESPIEVLGEKKGSFTTQMETVAGEYKYWIVTVDTAGEQSIPVGVSTYVDQPPDFVLHGELESSLDGTLSNAYKHIGGVVMPVNLTETWEDHFQTYNSFQEFINAGYEFYATPSLSEGWYEEEMDFGATLAASRIEVFADITLHGSTASWKCQISTSADNISWDSYPEGTSAFGTDFRYVKVRITGNSSDGKSLVNLTRLKVRLDAKKKYDSGNLTIPAGGSAIANFNAVLVDITSITVSPNSNTPKTSIYEHYDYYTDTNYTVSSNVLDVFVVNTNLRAGQMVKVDASSGGLVSGIYEITSVLGDRIRFDYTGPNTSGTCSAYMQSMVIYLFDQNGNPSSGQVSWSITGY